MPVAGESKPDGVAVNGVPEFGYDWFGSAVNGALLASEHHTAAACGHAVERHVRLPGSSASGTRGKRDGLEATR